ncbi:nucleoside deaminase [uncultured Sphaerochaeta sp.]|uniref:nucleoside deaminase n=1 Tax=uncultured Sphaerochaeta sp. TaxID=886478 RepID=UPI002A0A3D80|nr:nucleoside deaminase [uncultured Sphaerochaeta sp.]
MNAKELLMQAVETALKTMKENIGGPFGAALVDSEGKVYLASNSVLGGHDPTAHAEINVIRKACQDKKTHDLTGCIVYTTCYPCPMCLSACIWANIKEVYYGCTPKDAEAIGFRDEYIYRYINGNCTDTSVLSISQEHREVCLPLFEKYEAMHKEIY